MEQHDYTIPTSLSQYNGALTNCEDSGGTLAYPTNQAEHDQMLQVLKNYQKWATFIGVRDTNDTEKGLIYTNGKLTMSLL